MYCFFCIKLHINFDVEDINYSYMWRKKYNFDLKFYLFSDLEDKMKKFQI